MPLSRPARVALAALVALVSTLDAAILAGAGEQDPSLAEEGAALYSVYCSNCHGTDGEGRGPAVRSMKVKPADLTRLTEDRVFPAERVAAAIDGRRVTDHHKGRMPIWGLSFQDPGQDTNQEAAVRARIERLVAYLRSIQK